MLNPTAVRTKGMVKPLSPGQTDRSSETRGEPTSKQIHSAHLPRFAKGHSSKIRFADRAISAGIRRLLKGKRFFLFVCRATLRGNGPLRLVRSGE